MRIHPRARGGLLSANNFLGDDMERRIAVMSTAGLVRSMLPRHDLQRPHIASPKARPLHNLTLEFDHTMTRMTRSIVSSTEHDNRARRHPEAREHDHTIAPRIR